MSIALTTQQAAERLGEAVAHPAVAARTVHTLAETGALTDVGPGRSIRVDLDELDRFIRRIRRVDPGDWPSTWPLYRVSLVGLREDEILDEDDAVFRTHAGVNYAGTSQISPQMRERAWLGRWLVSEENVDRAVAEGAILFGTTRGYIDPLYVAQIVGARRNPAGPGIFWEVRPAPASVAEFVGSGLWMPVKPGRENDWA